MTHREHRLDFLTVFALAMLAATFSWVTPYPWWQDAVTVIGLAIFAITVTTPDEDRP